MIYKDTSRLLMHGVCTNVLADEVAENKNNASDRTSTTQSSAKIKRISSFLLFVYKIT